MNRRLLTTIFILSALILIPALTCADDLADLKAASQKRLAAANDLDANAWCAGIHDKRVSYGAAAIFATDGKNPNCVAAASTSFASVEYFQVRSVNPTYRVIGNIGIVYGHLVATAKLKDGAVDSANQRFINVYTKENGKWLLIAASTAYISVGE